MYNDKTPIFIYYLFEQGVTCSLESAINKPALAGSQDLSTLVTHEDDDPGSIRTLVVLFHHVVEQ
jgi:hypothetical protein